MFFKSVWNLIVFASTPCKTVAPNLFNSTIFDSALLYLPLKTSTKDYFPQGMQKKVNQYISTTLKPKKTLFWAYKVITFMSAMHMGPTPRLESRRYKTRKVVKEDILFLHKMNWRTVVIIERIWARENMKGRERYCCSMEWVVLHMEGCIYRGRTPT
jgi:hypothetical protein